MGNCLKTTLKNIVDNDNLNYLNSFRVNIKPDASETTVLNRGIAVYAYQANKVTLKCIGGTFNDSEGNPIPNITDTMLIEDANVKHNVFFSPNTKNIQILGRDYLRRFLGLVRESFTTIDLKELQYCTNLVELSLSGKSQSGKLEDIAKCSSLVSINLTETDIEGNVSDLKENINIRSFAIYSSKRITGDFASWAPYGPARDVTVRLYVSQNPNQVYCNGVDLTSLGVQDITLSFDGNGNVSMAAAQ